MRKVETTLVDDIDGSVAERTFTFGVDGASYEIDLSSANIGEFTTAIGGFVESARKVARSANAARADRDLSRRVRKWAQANNLAVSDRGRLPGEIIGLYREAMG